MNEENRKRPIWLWAVSFVAVVFGLLTIKSGAGVLFGDGTARSAAGDYVEFVVWFNFLAGFVYVAAGAGLLMGLRWSAWLALGIAFATLAVFGAFGVHVLGGGDYEQRTVAAMSIRSALWLGIAVLALRWLAASTPRP